MNHETNKKLNNKGFSLVELIIVIAIMAVLIGVLAPQYLRYVERSREATDVDNVEVMISAIEMYSADPAEAVVTGTLTCTNGTVAAAGAVGTDGTVADALDTNGINPANLPAMGSDAFQNWTITFAADGVTFSAGDDGADLQEALGR